MTRRSFSSTFTLISDRGKTIFNNKKSRCTDGVRNTNLIIARELVFFNKNTDTSCNEQTLQFELLFPPRHATHLMWQYENYWKPACLCVRELTGQTCLDEAKEARSRGEKGYRGGSFYLQGWLPPWLLRNVGGNVDPASLELAQRPRLALAWTTRDWRKIELQAHFRSRDGHVRSFLLRKR